MNSRRLSLHIALALVCLLSGMACAPQVAPPDPREQYQAHCSALCEHLRRLGCEAGQPLRDGTSCETFCIDTNLAGHPIPRDAAGKLIPQERIAQMQSCTELQR